MFKLEKTKWAPEVVALIFCKMTGRKVSYSKLGTTVLGYNRPSIACQLGNKLVSPEHTAK